MRSRRSTEPNRYSAAVLASSVLPVPVGRANRKTPIGRPGSLSPALSMAMRSMTLATASSWPMTRLAKNCRMEARSRRSWLSSMETGKPVSWDRVLSTSADVILAACLSARLAVSRISRRAEPGKLETLRYWRAEASATAAQSGSIVTWSSSDSRLTTAWASRDVSASDCGSRRMTSRRLRIAGRICSRSAVPVGLASVQITSRPAAMAGSI
jgi:hypothetical protein